jgi:hypothetical protein
MTGVITAQIAHQIVSEYLAKSERRMNEFGSALPEYNSRPHLHLAISQMVEHDFGWVIFYDTKEYLETQDIKYALAGNAPLILDRNDWQLYVTGSAHSVEYYVDQYRQGNKTRA